MPRHVAIVMDGNGRWAKKRFMPRFFGHKQGVDALVRTVQACADRGIEYLTVFAFSSENWKRPDRRGVGPDGPGAGGGVEVPGQAGREGVRIRIVGDRSAVSDKVRAAWDQAEGSTAHNTRITLSVAFNYGGRWDVVQACRQAMAAGVPPEELDEARLHAYMALSYAPDPDLFIRTGGEVRISNFLLWQVAYSELVLHRLPVAGLRRRRARRGAGRVRRPRPPLRHGVEPTGARPPRGKLTRAQAARHHRVRAAGVAAAGAVRSSRVAVRLADRSR